MPFVIWHGPCLDIRLGATGDYLTDLRPSYQIDDLYIPLVYASIIIEDWCQHQCGVSDQTKL